MSRMERRRGSAAVEFAVTFPIMLLIVLGMIETSLHIHEVYTVERAARDACRVGALVQEGPNPDGTILRAAAATQALEVLRAAGVDCDTVTCTVDTRWFIGIDDWYRLDVAVTIPSQGVTQYLPWTNTTANGNFTMLTRTQGPVPEP